jgi:hypothetical protein
LFLEEEEEEMTTVSEAAGSFMQQDTAAEESLERIDCIQKQLYLRRGEGGGEYYIYS